VRTTIHRVDSSLETGELSRQIRSDLEHLRSRWTTTGILDENDLRRDVPILRRLLIDGGGGLLRTYRKATGARGDVKVEYVDLNRQLAGLDRKLVSFASAGGATHNGMSVSGALEYRAAWTPEQVKARYEHGLATRKSTLQTFLDSPCMVVDGTKVNRRNLLQFVSNRLGGVHYDESREHTSPEIARQFEALGSVLNDVRITDHRSVYFELLSIGQALLASPEILELLWQ
jgi:hypothetical protein